MRFNKKTFIILGMALCVCVIAITAAMQVEDSSEGPATSSLESLSALNKNELLLELDNLSRNDGAINSDGLITAAVAFGKKAGEFSDEEIISILKGDKYSDITKIAVIQSSEHINNGNGIQDETEYLKMLMDISTDKTLRLNLINAISFSNQEDRKVLENLIADDDGDITMLSMKKLSRTDFDRAVSISDRVLEDHANSNSYSIRASVKVKSQYFRESKENNKAVNEVEKKNYIDLCMDLYRKSNDGVFKDTMIFSLSEMKDYEALKTIIQDNSVDLKRFCIDQNYSTLSAFLQSNPDLSEEDVNVVITAMYLYPLIELRPFIENINPKTEHQKNEIVNVLAKIDEHGIHASENWIGY